MNRTREEFIRLHQHLFMGLLLDAVTARRSGGEQALWLDCAAADIKKRLGAAYDDLIPKPDPKPAASSNGTPAPTRKV
jgi:hypothetical protein